MRIVGGVKAGGEASLSIQKSFVHEKVDFGIFYQQLSTDNPPNNSIHTNTTSFI